MDKTSLIICIVSLVVFAHPVDSTKDLRKVISESSCAREDNSTVVMYHIQPKGATLIYVKCFALFDSQQREEWRHVYTHVFRKNSSVASLNTSHSWRPDIGMFSLQINNLDAKWVYCDFSGTGQHRSVRAYTEIPRTDKSMLSTHRFPQDASLGIYKKRHHVYKKRHHVYKKRHHGSDAHLRDVLGSSGCFQSGSDFQIFWRTVPVHAKIFHIKCFRSKSYDTSEDRELLFTYRQKRRELYTNDPAKRDKLSFIWNETLGQASIYFHDSAIAENGVWYYCVFAGKGRHRHKSGLVQLESLQIETEDMTTDPKTKLKDALSWTTNIVSKLPGKEFSANGAKNTDEAVISNNPGCNKISVTLFVLCLSTISMN